MIDLHTHSNCSDGSDSYVEILKKAEKLGIECLSITDHDNCKVYEQIKKNDITKYFSGKLICGVELQAYILGFSIELLGYGIDYNVINEEVKNLYLGFEKINAEELKRLYNKCVEIGMVFEGNVLEDYKSSGYYYATEYLHYKMRENEYNKQFVPDEESWERESIFFKRHTSNKNSKFYVDESDLIPSVKDVITLIRKAGGLVFIPHIYQYEENAEVIFNELVNKYEIDGIECFYSTFTEEQTNYLVEFCKKNNKYISGGTDYHGSNRPGTNLGIGLGNMNIKYDIAKEWIEKLSK
ncbi:MAG: PHP domain-containing protein [Clostridia bacterium]|nr:PHP domain-containing protein [Clostridia bacterium]